MSDYSYHYFIHYFLKGGVGEVEGDNTLLSAYVLATLGTLSSDTSTTDPTAANLTPDPEAISKAIACVERDQSTHPYSLALRAYSLAQNKAPSATAVIKQLTDIAVTFESEMFWDLPEPG